MVVSNAAGLTAFCKQGAVRHVWPPICRVAFESHLELGVATHTAFARRRSFLCTPVVTAPPARPFKLSPAFNATPVDPTVPAHLAVAPHYPPLPAVPAAARILRHILTVFADGSAHKNTDGGCVAVALNPDGTERARLSGRLAGEKAPVRCELAALLLACSSPALAGPDVDLTIMSDCKAALDLVYAASVMPWSMPFRKHAQREAAVSDPAPDFGLKNASDRKRARPSDVTAIVQSATVGERARRKPNSVPATWLAIVAENSLDVGESQAFNRHHLPHWMKRGLRRQRSSPWFRGKGQQCPVCSRTFHSSTHGRLACGHQTLQDMRTAAHNVAVARVADALLASGRYDGWHMLVNAGKKNGYDCDWTVPHGLLPDEPRPGQRGYPDTPDIVLIRGWAPGAPLPADKSTMHLLLIEIKYTGDKNLQKRRAEAGAIYVTLLQRLHAAGYTIIGEGPTGLPAAAVGDEEEEGGDLEVVARRPAAPPTIFTLVLGVRDTYTTQFMATLATLGIRTRNLSRLLRQLHRHTIASLLTSARQHTRLCRAKAGVG